MSKSDDRESAEQQQQQQQQQIQQQQQQRQRQQQQRRQRQRQQVGVSKVVGERSSAKAGTVNTVTEADILAYLRRIKVTFAKDTAVHARFVSILNQFMTQKIPTLTVMSAVYTLFEEHR